MSLWLNCYSKLNIIVFYILIALSISKPLYALAQTDSTEQFKAELNAYPYAYYTPETELAFGAGGVFTFYTLRDSLLNPSSVTLSGYYATVKTYQFSLLSNLFFARNRVALFFDAIYGHYVDRFYGIGNNTPELGSEEYVLDNVGGIVDFQIPPILFISNRAGLVFEYRNYSIFDKKENPYLLANTVTGSNGGAVVGLGLTYIWDTRDQIFFPNVGGFTQTKLLFYLKNIGSDFTFTWVEVNGKRYWSFKTDHVFALQLYLLTVGGNPPFFKTPALGGSRMMRGYYAGRYRDKTYLTTQIEYRQYFWQRFGFVVFAGIGDVAPEITRLRMKEFKASYGAGLRFLFNKKRKINLRMDVGFGKNTNGIYFGIEEAF